jgi:membrane protein
LRELRQSQTLSAPKKALEKHRYSTPWFLLRETLGAFRRHNGFSISASLSFYAMFALIPMALLMFFLLSHLVISSNYAIVKLAILTSNLVPKFSQRIMIEVYNISKHKAVWGAFGMFALFWAVTPLAGALRTSFHTISAVIEVPSFIRRAFKDAVAVISILLLLFLFTFSGLMLEKLWAFLDPKFVSAALVNSLSSILLSTLMLAAFYRAFFPVKVLFRHILIGSLFTAALWIAMRPAFSLFLLVNQSYGTIFGGMKNMFLSIGWLYYSFAVFLLGTELISALHKKNVLLLKNLFSGTPRQAGYLNKLAEQFGREYWLGDYIFREGENGFEMYYVVSGTVDVYHGDRLLREVKAGEYFGEMAVLSGVVRTADATVQSEHALILHISADNIETLLQEEPAIAMSFLREMALRMRQSSGIAASQD